MRIKKEHFIKKKNYYIARFIDTLALPFIFLSKSREEGDKEPEKILLIGKHHVGDLLFITPLLAALRLKFAESEIYVTCPANYTDILHNNPNLDGFIVYGESSSNVIRRFFEMLRVVISIRAKGFDLGMSYNNNQFALNHLILFFSGIKRRIGYGYKGLSFLMTETVQFEGAKVIIEERLDFARHLGIDVLFQAPEIFLTGTEIDEAESIVVGLGLRPEVPVVGISPHAEHHFLWNTTDWVDLCRELRAEYSAEILFIGSPAAEEIVETIRRRLDFKTYTLAGMTTVRQAAGVIRDLSLLVGLDTGTRHIAAAEGTPVIFLRHGSDHDVELGPYGSDHFMVGNRVPCAPCGDTVCRFNTYACVSEITVEAVLNTIRDNAGSWMTDIQS